MMPRLVDTHCHLHFPAYDEDRDAVLSRMRAAGVWAITIGTALGNSERGIAFAETTDGIWTTVGLHPEHLSSDFHDEQEGDVDVGAIHELPLHLERLARSSKKVVGIGETGLDFFRVDKDRNTVEATEDQEAAFREQIAVAHKLDLPLVIHCRDGLHRLGEILAEEQARGVKVRGVVHSFTGTWEQAQPLLELGLYLGINGIATFPLKKNARPEDAIDRTIERMPLDRLLLETDAPYLAPAPFRGKRNEPTYVEEVAKHAANVRGMSFDDLAKATTENALTLFRLA